MIHDPVKELSMRISSRSIVLYGALLMTVTAFAATPAAPRLLNGTVRGVITDVKGSTITIMHAVTIDTSGATATRRGKSEATGDLQPGTRVTVAVSTMKPNKQGVLLADKITIDPSEATLSGPLDAVSDKGLSVLGQQVRFADATFFSGFVDGKGVRSASDLKLGYPVDVEIVPATDGPIALTVTAIGPAPRAPQPPAVNHETITGSVSAIDHNTWTVGGTRVYVVEQKTVVTGNPRVGDMVVVEGLKTSDGAIIASTIAKQQ